jgi:tripartite-type tricarboxylate transporter receptor subunit TctC
MKLTPKVKNFGVAITALLLCTGPVHCAESYPSKPGRLILPFGAGASTDIVGRIFAQRFAEEWGQTLIVDNRAGAGGRTRAVNRVPACGMRTSASRKTRR